MRKSVAIALMTFMTLWLMACTKEVEDKTIEESYTVEEKNEIGLAENTTSEENEVSEQETVSISAEKHILVAYFSVTGNTKTVADKIASVMDADLYEIKPAIEYTDADINYGNSESRTSKEQNDPSVRPEIRSEMISLEEYDTIYVGYPIWWGEEPRIMDTFVESYDFGNITMIPFCTSGSSSIGNSGKNLAKNAGSGNWLEGKRFDTEVSENDIKDWINGLQ